jgi:hypothetical protein
MHENLNRTALVVAGTITAVLVSGCGQAPAGTAMPSPADASASARAAVPDGVLDEQTLRAIKVRTENGLRSDVGWIQQVAGDPTATTEFGTPLLPAETADLFARNERADAIIPVIQPYLDQHADVFGGLWIDQSRGGVVTVSFTDALDPHREALLALLDGRGIVAVVPARYPEAEMRKVQERIARDDDWFATIPAQLQGVGYDVMAGVLDIQISSANPSAAAMIVDHFGLPEDGVRVTSDGTGAALLPSGTVKGVVVMPNGKPPGKAAYEWLVDGRGGDPGWCGGGDIGFGVAEDGHFEIPCKVGRRTIVILSSASNDGDWVVIGQADVVVPANRDVRVRIEVQPLAP